MTAAPRQVPAIEPLLSRVLADAIAYCKIQYEAEMSDQIPGSKPTPAAQSWRERAREYQRFKTKLDPPSRVRKPPEERGA